MRNSESASRRKTVRGIATAALLACTALLGPSAFAQCNFDVDANGKIDALTDGLLILRAGFGLTGTALTQGALGPGATRTDPTAIANFINANKSQYDIDGNGSFDALTDGLLILRSMFGLSGASLTAGAIGSGAARGDWASVNAYLSNGCTSISVTAAMLKDAARLLTQATWGPTYAEITALANSPMPQADSWVTQQFAEPRANHIDWINAKAALGNVSTSDTYESFWTQALTRNDQLRQRVAYALSQIMVISDQKDSLVNSPWAIAGYYDVLNRNAFGNFRTLLEDVTKNPGMGIYLDMVCNDKETATRVPNENYAREILQLFSVGTAWLNQDGTLMLDAQNQPIPTYDQSVVQGFAKAFTGWANNKPTWCSYPSTNNTWYDPMIAFNSHHSISTKTLLSMTPNGANVVLPAQTLAAANAQADLTAALDNIFNHPNVAPYISTQLIKFLVTSNPRPAYVSRVTAKFADNGSGVRGDMQAVIRAILTDPDARDPAVAMQDAFGKLREPVIRFGNLLRTFHASATSGRYHISALGDPLYGMNQQPLSSPTVFNFFGFDYAPQGAVGGHNLLGPEFEVTTSTSIVTLSNNNVNTISAGWGSGTDRLSLDYAALASMSATPQQIIDYLNLVMTNGSMTPATSTQLASAIALIPQTGSTWQADRWKLAIWILFNSPEYVIQR